MTVAAETSNLTAPTRFIETPAGKYAYRRFGAGAAPPLLCLQHFTGTLDFWDPAVTDALAQGREVILFENAGVGRSSGVAPDSMAGMAVHVLRFCDALGLARVDLLGFSLGGAIAQVVALERPALVRTPVSRDQPNKETLMARPAKTGLEALLRPEDSILVLIDHQPYQFANLNSHEPTMIVNNVIALAKTAKVFNVPTILTTVVAQRGGHLIKGLQDVFPEQKPIDRTFINTWEDKRVVEAVKKSGRQQLVLAALWSEICLAMPAIQALGDGYDVFVVTDASGGVSAEAHDMAVRRMTAAGAVPITWLAVLGEWQRDWAREETAAGLAGIVAEHGGASGVAFAWEVQLLGTHAK